MPGSKARARFPRLRFYDLRPRCTGAGFSFRLSKVGCNYFFDLPVYRLPRDKYYAAREAYVDSIVYQIGTPSEAFMRQREKDDPGFFITIRDHLIKKYGGCWRFNEIIGYVRLHFLGGQIRGEYFAVDAKRVVRTRKKTLEYKSHKLAPEVDIETPYGKPEILTAVRRYIEDCKAELPDRSIDTENFETLAPHVDWVALWTEGMRARAT